MMYLRTACPAHVRDGDSVLKGNAVHVVPLLPGRGLDAILASDVGGETAVRKAHHLPVYPLGLVLLGRRPTTFPAPVERLLAWIDRRFTR